MNTCSSTTDRTMRLGMAALLALAGGLALAGETIESVGKVALPADRGTARVMGMEAAWVGVAEGADALAWNPAGLATLAGPETGWHHVSGLDGALGEGVLVGLPLGRLGGLAVSGEYADAGEFERYDETGAESGTYGASTVGAGLGWGRTFLDGLAVGAAIRGTRSTLAGAAYSSVAGDLGALWSAHAPLKVGLALANLGSSGSASDLGMSIRAGASYVLEVGGFNRLLGALAAEIQPAGLNRITLGVEDTILKRLAVRAGYRLDLADQQMTGLAGLTAGVGVALGGLALDYAWIPAGDLGSSQRISLTYRKAANAEAHTHAEKGGS